MDITNRSCVDAFTTKDGSTIREIMAPRNASVVRQSLAEATVRPGSETRAHFHPKTEEIYYVLVGEGLMAVEEEQRRIGSGDAVAIPAGKRHQIRNTGDADLVFLCCCVPAYEDDDTIFCDALL